MAQFERWFTQDLNEKLEIRHCETVVFSADNLSAIVGVALYSGDNPENQTDARAICYAIRADGNTVEFAGIVNQNRISAILPQSCFVAPGPLAVMLQVIIGSGDDAVKTTVLKAIFTVEASETGEIIDPGHVIPDIEYIMEILEQAEQATETANNAAAAAEAAVVCIAPAEITSVASAPHLTGSYFIYDGGLYMATANIAQGAAIEPGTNCQAKPDGLAGELSALKSTIADDIGNAVEAWIDEHPDAVGYDDTELRNLVSQKVPKPSTNPNGTNGQVLQSNGDGTTAWADAAVSPEAIGAAVDAWLDEHPEAVTTVEDGSITRPKLAAALAAELDAKAPAIVGNRIDRVQENASKVTFIGNPYAWGNARYANRENYIKLPDTGAVTLKGVTITSQDGFAFFNGTAASGDDGSQFIMNVDIPAGTYTFTIEPYLGNGEVTNGKNMHLDFFYDGNTSGTQDKRATVEAAGLASKSVTVTTTAHTYKLKLWRSVGANTYNDYRLFYTLFASDVTITDTQQTVASGATLEYTLPAVMAVVDTMQHKSSVQSVLDTKEYVDGKVPKPASNPNGNSGQILQSNGDGSTAWIDYSADLGYLTPEMYGAYGDGSHDDSAAIQACIAASQAGINSNKCKAIRGFNKYRLGTGLIFHGREMDVFLNHIVYTPADGPAITISGAMCKFAFGDIRAENESGYDSTTGEGTLPSGIRLCTFVGGTGGMQDGCYDLDISCMYMRTMGPCIEYKVTENTTNVVMYHRFHVPYLYSKYSDCIHIGTGIQALNELDFYGKVILAPVGYGFYAEQVGIVRLHQFCFEQNLKNAIGLKSILAGGPVILQECRCRELEDTQTAADHTRGKLYVFDEASTYGIFDEFGGSMDVTAIDVSNALTLTQIFAEMRNRLDNGAVSADQTCRALPGFDKGVYATFRNCLRTANANMTTSGAMVPISRGTVYAYYRNVAYKPDAEIYHLVDADFTVALTDTNDYDYLTPTVFDIGAAAVDIHLDASYCPIAINEFDLIQYADKKAKVYDRAGNLIFDGTNLGAGIYHFTCSFVPLKSLTIKNTAETYTIVIPERDLKNFYTGECSGDYNTEKWTVKRQDLISNSHVVGGAALG